MTISAHFRLGNAFTEAKPLFLSPKMRIFTYASSKRSALSLLILRFVLFGKSPDSISRAVPNIRNSLNASNEYLKFYRTFFSTIVEIIDFNKRCSFRTLWRTIEESPDGDVGMQINRYFAVFVKSTKLFR